MIKVFGSVNFDLIGRVERLPRPGETVSGGPFATAPGGKGANQALAARRAGAAVQMIGAVGQDAFAGAALSLLQASGVDVSRVREVEGATGVALILVGLGGENVIAVMPGANAAVGEVDATGLEFAPEDVLLLQLEVPVAAIGAAARRATAAGARVLLNFAPFRGDALPLLPLVSHLIVNQSECALIAEAAGLPAGSLEGQAVGLTEQCGVVVIATLGGDGVIAVEQGRVEWAAALPVKAIDTVGAGDTFCGYLATAFSEGMPLADALALAATAASLACTKPGAQPAIPLRDQVNSSRAAPISR